jgi:hypothetical protein
MAVLFGGIFKTERSGKQLEHVECFQTENTMDLLHKIW